MRLFRKERELETERLVLRRWRMEDLPDFAVFGADPAVTLAAGSRPVRDWTEAEAEVRRFARDENVFAIVRRDRGQVIGKIMVQRDPHRMNNAGSLSVGYELAREHWGQGFMPEALEAVIGYVFRERRADVLGVSHFVGNEQSRRVIEKCGFRYEGRVRRSYRRFDGMFFDEDCYSITREEYFSRQGPTEL